MNIQVGKSAGIALLMAAALLAALFAMGVFSANGVGAQEATSTPANLSTLTITVDGGSDLLDPTFDTGADPQVYMYSADIPKNGMTATVTPSVADLAEQSVTIKWNDEEVALDSAATPAVTNAEIDLTKAVVSKVEVVVADANADNNDTAASNFVTQTFTIMLDHDYAANSMTAGKEVRLTLMAMLRADEDDEITVMLPSFGLPSDIDPSDITIASGDNSENPSDVDVSGSTISLVVPDMDPDTTGSQAIGSTAGDGTITNAAVTIRIKSDAGITNPTKAGMYAIKINDDPDGAGDDNAEEDVTNANDALNVVKVIREVAVKPTSGAGDTTVTGTGFTNGSVNVFIDTTPDDPDTDADEMSAMGNNEYDSEEFLGSATVTDGKFTLDLIALKRPTSGEVMINAIDSAGDTADTSAKFSFKESITLSPEEISPGEKLTIKVHNRGDLVSDGDYKVRFGGTGTPQDATFKDADEVTINVPSDVRTGKLQVELLDGNTRIGSAVNVEIVALSLTVTPSSVVPGQQVTIRGSGFGNQIAVSEIEFEGTDAITRASTPSLPSDAKATDKGSVSVTVTVPRNIGNGEKEVTLEVVGGLMGIGKITVAKPAISLDPDESLIGSRVRVTGSGFGYNDRVTLAYGSATANQHLEISSADGDGNVSFSFIVPGTDVDPGTEYTVTVKSLLGGDDDKIKATAKHNTPGPSIMVSESAQIGGTITITGTSWKSFSTISTVTIGGEDARPSPAPESDRYGNFEFEARVPRLSVGSHTVSVGIGSTVRTETFTVVDTPILSTPQEVFGGLGDKLVSVWRLDNATKVWSAYFPGAPEGVSDLTSLKSGDIVWVNVSEDVNFQGSTLTTGWNLISLE
ncbi:MAG: hypothetical protein F4X66_15660 [Chloroflexi bacterium]|nr:hypothetical protein [Chloroflexota bacterium]MYE40067.1 hypothetical protein [Chloroflexota bacterium]